MSMKSWGRFRVYTSKRVKFGKVEKLIGRATKQNLGYPIKAYHREHVRIGSNWHLQNKPKASKQSFKKPSLRKKKKKSQFEETDENAKEAFGAWEGGDVAESTEGRWVVRESPLADGAGSVREASVVYTYHCAHHRCGLIGFHHSLLSVLCIHTWHPHRETERQRDREDSYIVCGKFIKKT